MSKLCAPDIIHCLLHVLSFVILHVCFGDPPPFGALRVITLHPAVLLLHCAAPLFLRPDPPLPPSNWSPVLRCFRQLIFAHSTCKLLIVAVLKI